MYTSVTRKDDLTGVKAKISGTIYYKLSAEKKKEKYKIIAKKGDNYIISTSKFVYTGGPAKGSKSISHFYISGNEVYKIDILSEKDEKHQEIYQKLLTAFSDCPEVLSIIENKDIFFYSIQIANSKNRFYKQIEEAFKNNCFEE